MPAAAAHLQLSHELGICKQYGAYGHCNQYKSIVRKGRVHFLDFSLSSHATRQDAWSLHLSDRIYKLSPHVPSRYNVFICQSLFIPGQANEIPILKAAALALTRSYNSLRGSPVPLQVAPAIGIIAFAIWGLGPLMRQSRNWFLHKNDSNWKKSLTYYVITSYIQPLLLWTGALLICRVLDPVILPSEASQVIKQRLLNFVRSLSTVLAFAYCLSSSIQSAQKFFMESNDSNGARNMGFQFAGKAMYTGVWVAAFSLFMELLGFSTQKWVTAGGLGTVLITLAGREILTNFLSSVMIHATRPFVVNEWIQTKIEGYEVSGTVEHVGWWSPTIVRGDDREAVHIPNHKFTVNVVRNLSQKTHWRIKTHIAISHLDVNKINNIVADMRKVLAKNPQVEQQRLHRRVFLDNIDPENQALMILVSCFVKTSHFEEYLCVKEAILLDLLRVVSHHRARLATPIRTVQKIYAEPEIENGSFSETIFTRARPATNRPFLLIEPPSKISGDDKAKARPMRSNEEQDLKAAVVSDSKDDTSPTSDGSLQKSSDDKQTKKPNAGDVRPTNARTDGSLAATPAPTQLPKLQSEGHNSGGLSSSEGYNSGGSSSEDNTLQRAPSEKPLLTFSEAGSEKSDNASPAAAANSKHESEKLPVARPSNARTTLDENIVLGVALEGSKRTLPIEEGMAPSPTPTEVKELATCRNSNVTSSTEKEKQTSASPGPMAGDQREQER